MVPSDSNGRSKDEGGFGICTGLMSRSPGDDGVGSGPCSDARVGQGSTCDIVSGVGVGGDGHGMYLGDGKERVL